MTLLTLWFSFSGVNQEWRNCSQREEDTIKRSKTGSVPIHFRNFLFLLPPLVFVSYYVSRRDNLYFNAERAKRRHSDRMRRGRIDRDAAPVTDVHNYRYASCYCTLLCLIIGAPCPYYFSHIQNNCYSIELFFSPAYRIFAATWNVAGKSPPSYLSLEDWLHSSPPADIYVLG